MRRFSGDRLLVATHNAGKLEEIAALLAGRGIGLASMRDYDLPEPAETETTFVGNARIKAHAAAKATGLVALADDSGLCVEGLHGAPGSILRIGRKRLLDVTFRRRWTGFMRNLRRVRCLPLGAPASRAHWCSLGRTVTMKCSRGGSMG